MSSLRSSVRPKSSKQPWGTVLHPEFGMGYQKMTAYEIEQSVNRLYKHDNRDEWEYRNRTYYQRDKGKTMDTESIDKMVDRLREKDKKKAPVDSNRTQNNSIYKNMGVVNSYAWKGYN